MSGTRNVILSQEKKVTKEKVNVISGGEVAFSVKNGGDVKPSISKTEFTQVAGSGRRERFRTRER